MAPGNPTLLSIFVKAPRAGAVKTRLAMTLGPEAACAAYRCLLDTLVKQLAGIRNGELRFTPDDAAAELTSWRRDGWAMRPQGPGELGVRLQRAFA